MGNICNTLSKYIYNKNNITSSSSIPIVTPIFDISNSIYYYKQIENVMSEPPTYNETANHEKKLYIGATTYYTLYNIP